MAVLAAGGYNPRMAAPRARRGRPARGAPARAAAAACALTLAVAACGSAGGSGATRTSANRPSALRFADCLRAHGVVRFPDPLPSGGFPRTANDGASSPGYGRAMSHCRGLIAVNATPSPPSAAARATALRFARCMRRHGVPRFPDPVALSQIGSSAALVDGGVAFPLGASIDPSSPAYTRAATNCGQSAPAGPPRGG